jgi:hypothetical protein
MTRFSQPMDWAYLSFLLRSYQLLVLLIISPLGYHLKVRRSQPS